MDTFDYVILTDENKWEATGKQETQEQLDEAIVEVRTRLQIDEGNPIELVVVKAPKLEFLNA